MMKQIYNLFLNINHNALLKRWGIFVPPPIRLILRFCGLTLMIIPLMIPEVNFRHRD